jgi:hypothetical protein
MSPGPRSTGVPRMGDAADICKRVDRMDSLETRLARVEAKIDHLAALFDKALPPKAKR